DPLRDLGGRAGVRGGARAGERDEQPQLEAAPGFARVTREAVHDAAHLAHRHLGEDRERLLVGVPAVDEHGLAQTAREGELGPERTLLGVAGREETKKIEPRLADRDDARRRGKPLYLGESSLVG